MIGANESIEEPLEAIFPLEDLEDIEAGFWERESLGTIYTAALARMCSPWAVLGVCAAMVLAMVPPSWMLPPIIGGPGSLNWFCALAAQSGGGKDAAMSCANQILEGHYVDCRPVGSGEGMVESYRRPADKETGEEAGQYESIMFVAEEIDTIAAIKNRNGSTMMATLRGAFTGGRIGFSTKASNGFHLDAHSYRLTLITGVQPARSGTLLDDHGGGTPQRFMWFPATDRRVSVDCPAFPEDFMKLPVFIAPDFGPARLHVPAEAQAAIRAARAAAMRGEGDPLDSHALFVREKFAYALAVLDGRDQMTSADWELSGVAMRVSDHTRAWVVARRERADNDQAVQEGTVQGVRRAAADAEQVHQEAERFNRIKTRVVEKLTAAGAEGLTEGVLLQSFNSRDRGLVTLVLERLAEDGCVVTAERRPEDKTDRWVIVPE